MKQFSHGTRAPNVTLYRRRQARLKIWINTSLNRNYMEKKKRSNKTRNKIKIQKCILSNDTNNSSENSLFEFLIWPLWDH